MIIKHDKEREKRCGIPEIVFGSGKSTQDLIEISKKIISDSRRVIITRIEKEKVERILNSINKENLISKYNERGKVLIIKDKNFNVEKIGKIGILTAGTSDIPVAEEAREIARELGCETITEYDVGIAGLHRIFPALEKMKDCSVLIVIAGMEGALPSVIAGLTNIPVIGVPTSIGYGTAQQGRTALFTMLNSCTPVAVMNIDNGYGAAVFAYKILRSRK
ncbi:MAG: nickel pincer cofactor biosynthesis protein LarB [Candidatus Altiarchaeales archaeon]|nr:MAG: nickel pincer cofactor biosynthesis protein LarB [Candidatus Altiarchaeales archaeon]